MKWGHFISERSEVKHTVMSWLFSHSSGTTTRLVDGGERVLMFPLLKQSSWCSEKDSSCYVNSGSKVFLKCDVQWENIYVCSVSTLSAMDLNVLQSWAAPRFLLWTVLGSFLSAFWLLRVTTNSTNVRVICYFLAVGWNERAWISTNTTFLLQTWIYLKSQATVGTTLPVIF